MDLARRLQQKGLQIFTKEDAERPGDNWVTPVLVGVTVDDLPPFLKTLPFIKYAELEDYLAQFKTRNGAPVKARARVHHTN